MHGGKHTSKQKEEQDYSRNAIADYKSGNDKAANYEKKRALEVAAGEGMSMHGKTHGGAKMYGKGPKMESDAQQKTNLIDDNPIASRASGGSWMSKHSKSKM
jgi:hypothetical protein